MDFFEHQEKARQRTHLLVFYFVLAVVGIIVAIYALSLIALFFSQGESAASSGYWKPDYFLYSVVGTVSIIFLASTFKTMQLSGGGKVIALELGGRKMDTNTTDFHERRLLNVVEEMAIAAGVPVPDIYVMDGEESINAFAAGKTTSDAVIGVTRGCMKLLTRDELQGVIAHEFSHILNGDMKLNMRLIGLLFGILFIALIGQIIMRGVFHSSYMFRSNRKESGGIAIVILVAGLGLLAIGSIGLFFANLIKASISRQREFLADASAVQFTRNPDGLAGALKKLAVPNVGSRITSPMAPDASHLFFGNALKGNPFATHPPLTERIKRLTPQWDGTFRSVELPPITESSEPEPKRGALGQHSPIAIPGMFLAGDQGNIQMTEAEALESMSSVHPEQIDLGREMLEYFPPQWIAQAHSESGAQSIVFALLLGQDASLRDTELDLLRNATDETTFRNALSLHKELSPIHSAVKLGLIDLCIPTLRRLSPTEYERFSQIVNGLINSDNLVNLFEFTLQKMVSRHLDTYFQIVSPPRIKYRKIRKLEKEAAVLITTIAVLSSPEGNDDAIREAFRNGAAHIEGITYSTLPFLPQSECGLDAIAAALDAFAQATPIVKKQILHACSKSLMTDNAVTSLEAELIRAIADAIGCPIPPFVRTAPLI